MANYRIDIPKERIKLVPRDEPYWAVPLEHRKNRSLGFRKIGAVGMDEGSWVARRRKENGRSGTYALGRLTPAFGFLEARAAALEWFAAVDGGVKTGATVADACRTYVKDRRAEESEANAHDAEMRFRRTVYPENKDTGIGKGNWLGEVHLAKLKSADVKRWRNELVTPTHAGRVGISKSSANRYLTTLKAALNLAVDNKMVSATVATEWQKVTAFADAAQRRRLYLDLDQRRALLAAAKGNVRNLIEGVMLTGARAGELVNATRAQLDLRDASITLDGKTGPRDVVLSGPALALFKRLAEAKPVKERRPTDHLFVRDDGKPWAHSDWDELVREAADNAELPDGTKLEKGVCLYTLRHSFITQALKDGLPVSDVGTFVGTSATMIQKFYHKYIGNHMRERLAAVVMV